MSDRDQGAPVVGMAALVVLLCGAWWSGPAVGAADQPPPMNPHGDLIFRATGATSCAACHGQGAIFSGMW